MKKILLILLSLIYAQEITIITLEQRTDGSGMVDVCYDLIGTEEFSVFYITAEINFDGEWLPVSGASGDIGPTIEVGTEKCFEWNVKSQYPDEYSDNVQIRIHADSAPGSCIDIDGNVYETVQIGDQIWMAGNLKVTHYNNGDAIQYVQSESSEPNVWESLITGAYGFYNDDLSHQEVYGNLYNWYAVDDDRGICPYGWHVPTDDEYTGLTDYLGGTFVAGGKMKESGHEHWNYYNDQITIEATNESGFTGLPTGDRADASGNYRNIGYYGYFWSSTEYSSSYPSAWARILGYEGSDVSRFSSHERGGFSIRCLKD